MFQSFSQKVSVSFQMWNDHINNLVNRPTYFRFGFPTCSYIWQHCHSFLWNAGPRQCRYKRWNFAAIPFVSWATVWVIFTPLPG